jgi:hypothetical protein
MKSEIVSGIEVTTGKATIFADLGIDDVQRLKIKARLVIKMIVEIRAQNSRSKKL